MLRIISGIEHSRISFLKMPALSDGKGENSVDTANTTPIAIIGTNKGVEL